MCVCVCVRERERERMRERRRERERERYHVHLFFLSFLSPLLYILLPGTTILRTTSSYSTTSCIPMYYRVTLFPVWGKQVVWKVPPIYTTDYLEVPQL